MSKIARLVLCGALIVLESTALAQVPVERYRPMATGDVWVYQKEVATSGTPPSECGPMVPQGHRVLEVVGDTLVGGNPAHLFTCSSRDLDGAPTGSGRYAVSVDAQTSLVVTTVRSEGECGMLGTGPVPTQQLVEPSTIEIGGQVYPVAGRRTYNFGGSAGPGGAWWNSLVVFVADIGLVTQEYENGRSLPPAYCSRTGHRLVFARVGGEAFGTNPVSDDGPPAPVAALTLSASPVPATGSLTLRLAGAERAAIEVFGVDGRRVYTGALEGNLLVLPTRGWAPGVYVARATSAEGVATVRIVVAR